MAKHRDLKNRRMWWQIRLEYRHRWDAFKRDVAMTGIGFGPMLPITERKEKTNETSNQTRRRTDRL